MQNEVGHKQVYGAAPKNTQNQNSACTFQSKSWTFSLLLGEYLLSLRSLPWNYQSASNQSNRKEGFCAAPSLQSILPSNSQQPPVTTCQPVQEYNFFFSPSDQWLPGSHQSVSRTDLTHPAPQRCFHLDAWRTYSVFPGGRVQSDWDGTRNVF